jgi:hypothetical protein
MVNLCTQIWPCNVFPAEWHWIMAAIMPILMFLLVGIPVANVLHRAGRSRWWTILAFIPFMNVIGLWVFAFARWPAVDGR